MLTTTQYSALHYFFLLSSPSAKTIPTHLSWMEEGEECNLGHLKIASFGSALVSSMLFPLSHSLARNDDENRWLSLSASAYYTRILLVTEVKRKLTLVRTGEDDKAKSTILCFKGRGEKPTKREKRLNFFGRVMTAREGNIYCLLGSTHPARVKLQDTFSFSLSFQQSTNRLPLFPILTLNRVVK